MAHGQLPGQEFKQERTKGLEDLIRLLESRGFLRGIEEGIDIGIRSSKIKIVKNMLLNLKLDVDTVQKATELPKSDVEEILQMYGEQVEER
jgi:hypothetical protein